MSISGISSNTSYYQMSVQNTMNQGQQDFKNLSAALQTGNLSGAQQAFSDMQQVLLGSTSSSQAPGVSQANSSNPVSVDISTLGQALQSGDITGAQNDFTKLLQDLQSVSGGHHHRHHTGGAHNNTRAANTAAIYSSNAGVTSGSGTDSDGDNDHSASKRISVTA